MCSLSAPATWAVLWLTLIISSTLGDKVLSHRQFDYSTITCILDNPENQEAGDANLEECENKCKLASKVNIKTIMETGQRVRRYSFSISELSSDCITIFKPQETFDVRIFEDGRVEKNIPIEIRDIKSFSGGIIDLFLTSVHLHEGGETQQTEGCQLKKVESEASTQLIKNCNLIKENRSPMSTSISTYENAKLLYSSGGRSIKKSETKVYKGSVTQDVSITVVTLSALTATKLLDIETDLIESQINVEDEEIEENSDESFISDANLLLSQIQKNGPTSEEGSYAFLRLCLKLQQIDDLKTYEKLFSRYKTKKIFKYFVEASSVIHKIEFLNLIFSQLSKLKNKMFLEKYLFHLSFTNPSKDFVKHLMKRINEDIGIKVYGDGDTKFYTLCSLLNKEKVDQLTLELIDNIIDTSKSCTEIECQILLTNCIGALGVDRFWERTVDLSRNSPDQKVRELAVKIMSGSMLKERRDTELIGIFNNHTLSRIERIAAIKELELDDKLTSWLMETRKHKRRDVGEFLRQKIIVQENEKLRGFDATTNYDFQAISKSEQSMIVEKNLGSVGPRSLHLSFAVLKDGSAMKRSSLVLFHRGSEKFEYFRMDSHVGGLSSFVGEEDPDDDKDPNASVQIKLLGVPLKPVTLFTSLSELMEIYWSGVAEKMTSYLSGTVQLFSERDDTVLGNGLRLRVQLFGTLALDLGAKAVISLWSQSGEVECENRGAVSLMARVTVGDSLLVSERMVTVETALMSNIRISMSGGEPLVCVVLNQNPVRVKTLHKYGKGGDLTEKVSNKIFDGVTWNLGHKNNMLCNKLK